MTQEFIFHPDYSLGEILWIQPRAVLVRARSASRMSSVLLKMARDRGDEAALRAWKEEYGLLMSLEQESDAPLDLETWDGLPVLVMPDTGAEPLSSQPPLSFSEPLRFLNVAAEICTRLEKLHAKGLIHQFLTPDNILVNRANLKACLLGLTHTSPFFTKVRGAFDLRIREGCLHCVAPEQTGMINRLMDGRTDVYALGCVFYEMLFGRPVCESPDAAGIMAFHLSGRAVPARENNPDVPDWLWGIVSKCLAKEPDERYQTIGGLLADISACMEKIRKRGKIASFTPGRQDVSPFLRLSGKVVGRNEEIKSLSEMVEQVAGGGRGAVLVAGSPGVGKTSLISEIFPLLAASNIPLLSGKFESVVENRPYAGICRAVSAWAVSVSFEDDAGKSAWAQKLHTAMGGFERVIVDLAPESAFLFESPPPLPDFPPREAQSRFFLALSRFFSAVAEDDGLALFMDDLQWADQSTISFLAQAAGGAVSGRFLLLGAFRDNEVNEKSPVNDLLSSCASLGQECRVISLHPLSLAETEAMVDEACGGAAPKGRELVDFIFERSSGNPFFVKGILYTLMEDGGLFFDHKSRRFSFKPVKALALTDLPDQRALLRGHILSLTGSAKEMLCAASVVGDSFSPETVATLVGEPLDTVEQALSEAVAKKMIRQVSGENGGKWLNFTHDHVREEAYAMLPPGRAAAMHLDLSRRKPGGMDPVEAAFWVADNVNRAMELITFEKDLMDAARKNLTAGKLARESAAFGPAWRYLSAAVSFLPENAWKRHYKVTLEIYTAAAEAAYLAADSKVASKLSATITKRAKSKMDRAKALRVAFLALLAKNRLSEAVSDGVSALRELGFSVSEKPGKLRILYYFLMARLSLPRRRWDGLLGRQGSVPARKELAMSIYNDIALCAYSLNPDLIVAAILHQVCLIARGGLCPQAGAVMAFYGFLLDQDGRPEEAYEAGLLAEKLQKRWPGHRSEATTLCLVNSMIRPWKDHMRESISGLDAAYESGIRAGNFEWGTMAAWVKCYLLFYSGMTLSDVDREMRRLLNAFKAMGQEKGVLYLELDFYPICALVGDREMELYGRRDAYRDPVAEKLLLDENDEIALSILYTNRMLVDYFFGRYESAAASGRNFDRWRNGAAGCQAMPISETFDCLSMLALPDPFADKKRLDEKIAKLSGWAKNCPQNNQHKLDLVMAEMAGVSKKHNEARRLYGAAIKGAKENGFLNFEALGLELFAKFCLMNNEIKEGMKLLGEARSAYAAWGALAKVKSLDEKYGMVFMRPEGDASEVPVRRESPVLSSLADTSGALADMEARLLAAAPEDRVGLFLKLLCPLAGASGGCILVMGNRVLAVRAVWGEESAHGRDTAPLITGDDLARFFTRKAFGLKGWVLAFDVEKEDLPARLRTRGNDLPRSVLCGPVVTGLKNGALYLENRFLKDAFDASRVNLVKKAAEMFSHISQPQGRFNRR